MRYTLILLAVLAYGQQGVPGVTVSAGGLTATTDANGYYSITVPAPFYGTVYATKAGFNFTPASFYIGGATSPQTVTFRAVDIAAPAVAITVPDTLAAGPVTLTCVVSDNVGVVRVEWSWDGAPIGTASAAPWSLAWVASAKGKGKHALGATAVDAAGNRATASKTIRMQ